MKHTRLLAPALLLSALCACDSGGGDSKIAAAIGPIRCAGLTGATATGSVACTAGECRVEFHEAAIDGDLGTYATFVVEPASSGSVSLRATAQEGTLYPAGTPAAVVYGSTRTGGSSVSPTETITTYLDGVMQETQAFGTDGVMGGDDEPGRNVMSTNLPFDAIELGYVQSGGTAHVEVRIYEFCTSAN